MSLVSSNYRPTVLTKEQVGCCILLSGYSIFFGCDAVPKTKYGMEYEDSIDEVERRCLRGSKLRHAGNTNCFLGFGQQ